MNTAQPLQAGDVVVCRGSNGYAFTTGREYTVVAYEPPFYDNTSAAGFTWPAYVEVIDDTGRNVHCHARRFVVREAGIEPARE